MSTYDGAYSRNTGWSIDEKEVKPAQEKQIIQVSEQEHDEYFNWFSW